MMSGEKDPEFYHFKKQNSAESSSHFFRSRSAFMGNITKCFEESFVINFNNIENAIEIYFEQHSRVISLMHPTCYKTIIRVQSNSTTLSKEKNALNQKLV